MRRGDREVTDSSELLEIMRRCDVCRLALNGDHGFPYIVALLAFRPPRLAPNRLYLITPIWTYFIM